MLLSRGRKKDSTPPTSTPKEEKGKKKEGEISESAISNKKAQYKGKAVCAMRVRKRRERRHVLPFMEEKRGNGKQGRKASSSILWAIKIRKKGRKGKREGHLPGYDAGPP